MSAANSGPEPDSGEGVDARNTDDSGQASNKARSSLGITTTPQLTPELSPGREGVDDDEQRMLVSKLCEYLETYLEADAIRDVYSAYLFGAEAHEGQQRMSGEPYIYHPLAVARILAGMHMDGQTIVAAILHDVIEDTSTAKAHISELFGSEVAELVDGVSKITQIDELSRAEAQAASFQKMLMAMAVDIRVIIIKLADRIHNMRTLGAMPAHKRQRIARETLEIYAPIANRLGMNAVRLELEDLGFEALHPWRARIIRKAVKSRRGNRKEILGLVETAFKHKAEQESVEGSMVCREKHLFGIYRKMMEKDLPFDEVYDLYAVRIIVGTVDACYRMIGVMHNLYKPVPGKFKDYIAIPKSNGYQSLHTVVFGPHGVHMEIQIRTTDMEAVSESGVAAHWLYKSGDDSIGAVNSPAHNRAQRWLREMLELQQQAGDSVDFLESVKVDLFPDEVYVFSPKGEIIELPRGATAVDFAYAIHSDIGDTCVAVLIDRREAPLGLDLRNGQTVNIITSPQGRPRPSWLDFVATAKARSSIRHFLKSQSHSEAVALGRRMIQQGLKGYDLKLVEIEQLDSSAALTQLGVESMEALFEEVGLGTRTAAVVCYMLASHIERTVRSDGKQLADNELPESSPLEITGREGKVVSFARCCWPIPGDKIRGHASAGRGLVVHTRNCRNQTRQRGKQGEGIELEWAADPDSEFPVELWVKVANHRGVLASVAAEISAMGCDIVDVESTDAKDGKSSNLRFVIGVHDRNHLAQVMKRIKQLEPIDKVSRVPG